MISIIVPVYNAEKYLPECIESILAQTYTDFELLLLDDGSKDNSGTICDEYAAKDKRIKVIHKKNEGINATRQRGVKEAKGEWITFCDDDDTLFPDALSELYSQREGTDIVIGFYLIPKERISKDAPLADYRKAQLTGRGLSGNPWAKLYRRTLFDENIFKFPREIDGEEDMIMNVRLLFKTNRVPHVIYKTIYYHREHSNNFSRTKKRSIKHEEAFYSALYSSIPNSASWGGCLNEIIELKFNGLFHLAYANTDDIIKNGKSYIEQLKKDVKQANYKLSTPEVIILKCHSKNVLKIMGFIILSKISIKYRLSLLLKKDQFGK